MATIDANLNFNANANYQKIFMEGSVSITVANPNRFVTSTVSHNLGYKPNVKVWWENASGYICTAVSSAAGSNLYPITTDFANRSVYFTVGNNDLTLYLDRNATSGTTRTAVIYYRIYADGI